VPTRKKRVTGGNRMAVGGEESSRALPPRGRVLSSPAHEKKKFEKARRVSDAGKKKGGGVVLQPRRASLTDKEE